MTATRILTAIVLVPVVVATILYAPTSVVALAVALVAVLALQEFFALGARTGLPGYPRWTMLCSASLIVTPWIFPGLATMPLGLFPPLEFFLLVFVLGAATLAVVGRRETRDALPSISASATGLLFIAWPLSYAARLHGFPNDGRKLVLLMLAVVWVGDTAAYFVGRAIGRHKLAPVISPNKTWEGAAANVVGAAAAAAAFQGWLAVPLIHLLGVGAVASVAGQVGDLMESAFKRAAGAKDSGTLLPGHGGMLDRIDALILAAPAVWWYFELVVWR